MKHLTFLIIPLLFAMCQTPSGDYEKAQNRSDSLQRLVIAKDSALYAFMGTMNSIENNLQEIKAKENIITLNANEAGSQKNQADQINEDIQFIYDLMLENKQKVTDLEHQLRQAGIANKELQQTIRNLHLKLQEKDAEILELQTELKKLNIEVDEMAYKIDTLNFDNQVKQAIIDTQDETIHTAYYLFGSAKELKENGIIDKKGSLIHKRISKDFDKSLFTKIDIRELTEFNLNCKKVNILTTHPGVSYTLVGEKPIEKLEIDDSEEFWSVSKYLIIIID